MDVPDYVLHLEPVLMERAWAGRSLGAGIGEAWDLSVHEHGSTRIRNGALAGRTLREAVDAHPVAFGGGVKLLAKRLDCGDRLSVQVHPKSVNAKTEAWVVLEAEAGAGVYRGFCRDVTESEVRAAVGDGTIEALLEHVPVGEGDAVFVPAGTVHAIGAGLRLFEIQQSSDTTYRLFDWDRGRDTHVEEALRCADLSRTSTTPAARRIDGGRERLLDNDLFRVDRVEAGAPVSVDPGGDWAGVFVVHGSGTLGDVALRAGGTAMLPAAAGIRTFVPSGEARLLVYGPPR